MLKAIHFKNFKCLRDTTLPLEPFTLLIGPNGAGKSTALLALEFVSGVPQGQTLRRRAAEPIQPIPPTELVRSAGLSDNAPTSIRFETKQGSRVGLSWLKGGTGPSLTTESIVGEDPLRTLIRARVYRFDAEVLARDAPLKPSVRLGPRGEYLVAVIDRLRDEYPERFQALSNELSRCLPEFDSVGFLTPVENQRRLRLRSAATPKAWIPAQELSQGTLLAIGLLTLAHLPDPPPIIGLEEPDHGLHPRLLRDVRDALYRLAYPQDYGEDREPIQVIATTHSPVFLDLFRDHPEQVVIAEKHGLEARFRKLTECEYLNEILESTPLGEAWYTGVLGGVPEKP